MPHDIVLPIWPSITNCLSWSADSELAIAAEGHIELLLPKLKLFKLDLKNSRDNLWSTLHLRVDQFTQHEVAVQEPLTSANFSVGEELSSCVVLALAWSPSGLAKHGRSALAVLTSNLVLSIWAPGGDPTNLSEWKRVLLINRALDGFSQGQRQFDGLDEDAGLKHAKKKQRVRAFAWSQPLALGYECEEHLDVTEIGSHTFLAISNDCNEIVLMLIESRHRLPAMRKSTWVASVSRLFHIDDFNFSDTPSLASTFEEYMSKAAYVNHIAWSPWSPQDASSKAGASDSFIAYTTPSKLAIRIVRSLQSTLDLTVDDGDIFVDVLLQSHDICQLKWLPTVSADYFELVATLSDQIRLYHLSVHNPKRTQVRSLSREEWDPVSGITHGLSDDGTPVLYCANFVSTSGVETSELAISFMGEKLHDNTTSRWQKKITQQQRDFSKAHNLDGLVCSKVWGIASSPLGSLVATVSSQHPADLPEYVIPADHKSHLNITSVLGDDNFLFPNARGSVYREDFSTETMTFGLLQWINVNDTISWEDSTVHQHLAESLEAGWVSSALTNRDDGPISDPPLDDYSLLARIRYLRRNLFKSKHAKSGIAEQLVSLTDPSIEHWGINDQTAVRTLVTTVTKLPIDLDRSRVSRQIRTLYKMVESKISGVGDNFDDATENPEYCGICDSNVVLHFTDLRFASGICGHNFGKKLRMCALSRWLTRLQLAVRLRSWQFKRRVSQDTVLYVESNISLMSIS